MSTIHQISMHHSLSKKEISLFINYSTILLKALRTLCYLIFKKIPQSGYFYHLYLFFFIISILSAWFRKVRQFVQYHTASKQESLVLWTLMTMLPIAVLLPHFSSCSLWPTGSPNLAKGKSTIFNTFNPSLRLCLAQLDLHPREALFSSLCVPP